MRRDLPILLLLVLLPLVAFWQVGQFGFVNYDDRDYVYGNDRVLGGLGLDGIRWAFTSALHHWHPLTWISLMLDTELYAGRPAGYHRTNLFLHVLNGLLLFGLLHRMTAARWKSFFVAALFAIHPMHVEPVVWVASRKDVLSTFFGLLALHAYVSFIAARSAWRYALIVLAWVASLLAKQMLVTLPFLLLLLDLWPLQRLGTREELRRAVVEKLPLLAIAVGFSVAAYLGLSGAGAVQSIAAVPVGLRVSNALTSYVLYGVKTVWPVGLAPHYPFPIDGVAIWKVLVSVACLTVVSAVALSWWRKRPYVLVGWSWYLGTLVPVIGLVQLGSFQLADRYSYVPLIGLFVAGVWLAESAAPVGVMRDRVLPAAGAVLLVVLTVSSAIQVGHWRNSETLFRHTIAVTRDNGLAHYNLGTYLAGQERYREAVVHLTRCIEIEPNNDEAHANLGGAYMMLGDLDRALTTLRRAVTLDPNVLEQHMSLGAALQRMGRLEEAIASYRNGLRLAPDHVRVRRTLATAQYELATGLLAAGDREDAIPRLEEALRLAPDMAEVAEALQWARSGDD